MLWPLGLVYLLTRNDPTFLDYNMPGICACISTVLDRIYNKRWFWNYN